MALDSQVPVQRGTTVVAAHDHEGDRTPEPGTAARGDAGGARPRVSVVIPALNEARNLLEVLPALPAVEQVVLVDGGSVDGSVDAALSVLPEIEVVHQTRRGKGNALACGFEAATGDIVVTFPADGSGDPAEVQRFVETLLAGADIAQGSRFLPGGGSEGRTRLRHAGNRLLSRRANALFDTGLTDLCYGFNAFWADVLGELALPDPSLPDPARRMPAGDGFEIETLISCRAAATGLAVTEVPSRERRRRHGSGNARPLRDTVRALRTIHAERRRARRLEGRGRLGAAGRPASARWAPSPAAERQPAAADLTA